MKFVILTTAMFFLSAAFCQEVSTFLGPNQWINDGITFDQQGNLYGSDHAGFGVYKYDVAGELTTLATFDHHPNGIVLDDDNNLYVATPQGNKIFMIDVEGNVTQYGPEIPNPNGLIFKNGSDTLIITSYANNTLSKLSPDGTLAIWIDSDDLNGPLGLCYDDQHVLYVSNFNDGNMFKVIGNQLEYFATVPGDYLGGTYFSTGYIMWHDGYVYATGFAKNKIYRIDENGDIQEYAGSGVFGYLDGEASEARFMNPNGIAMKHNSNEIYISGYESHAVRLISESTQGIWNPDINNSDDILIYPNPASNIVHVRSKPGCPIQKIEIYTLMGRLLKTKSFDSCEHTVSEIKVQDLSPGNYVLKVYQFDEASCCSTIISINPKK